MKVMSVSFQQDLALASLASGCSTCIVVNIGEYDCQAMCVAQGRPLLQTFKCKFTKSIKTILKKLTYFDINFI